METKLTGISTYAETINKFSAADKAAENAPAAEVAPNPEVSNSTVSQDGVIDTPSNVAVEDNIVSDEPKSEIELDFGSFDEPAPATEGQPQTTTSAQSDWRSALKNADKKEVLKELGVSDFAAELNEHILRGGDPQDYLFAKGIDYNKVVDIDLLRDDMRSQFPDATASQIERLLNKKYNQTDLAEDEDKEDGMLMMKADARKIREQRIAKQQSFKMPEPIQVQQQQPNVEAEQKRQQIINKIIESEAVKALTQSKRVAIQLGENEAFNFDIKQPEVIVKAITDSTFWQKLISNDKGEPDVSKLIKLAKYGLNMEAHDKALFNYGKQQGHRVEIEKGQNAKLPTGKAAIPVTETLGQAFKNRARLSTYGTPA